MALAGRIKREIGGVLLAFAGLYLLISLFTYEKWDPSAFTFNPREAHNYGGNIGAFTADVLISGLGYVSFSVPAFMLAFGILRVLGRKRRWLYLAGSVLFIITGACLMSLSGPAFGLTEDAGGLLGRFMGDPLVSLLSVSGAYLISLCGFLASLIMLSPVSLLSLLHGEAGPSGRDSGLPAGHGAVSGPLQRIGSGVSEVFSAFREGKAEIESFPFDTGADDLLTLESPLEDRDRAIMPRAPRRSGKFKLPPVDMLKEYVREGQRGSRELQADADLLVTRLKEFSVMGRVEHIHAGPVVTLFEFEPAAGVKMNKVMSLADDLALGLKARSIRISAVPNKATIGIEIPNRNREVVSLRDMVSSGKYSRSASRLTIVMGKDIFGRPVVADLASMPHLLVAGATGSGKSVFINSVIMSMIFKAGPEEVKMLMIDPKLLELSVYDGIPQLLAPVVTSPKDASEMLRRMVFEMERRYRVLAEQGVRNIESFNASASGADRLPYIVIIIDELADLMLASSAQVEDSIARLAQMARAAGIHIILATQRPSVDVITGVIKANFPARVAFQVSSGTDSRTIIGSQGAEQLIGRGDMLYMRPGKKIARVHGALVTEAEVNDAVRFVKSQGSPDYSIIKDITRAEEDDRAEAEHSEDRDEHFWRAVEQAEAMGEISISSIQRKLKIGYNRAARIMELMEEDGMVGPPKGAGKPRDFLGRGGL
jgi:S-DNA-T family DNA segregation ATPase FtsK/SpoIIIE